MLDLPDHPVIDKHAIVGRCARLPLTVDADRLAAEFVALPAELWGTTGGRVGVHRAANAVFMRGHAPAEGNLPIEDRPAFAHMPYLREIVEGLIPAPPLRCLLARLPAGAVVAPHVDRAPYFSKTLRIHIPVETHQHAWMVCGGLAYRMARGEVWALNNVAPHGVWNADPSRSRTHVICDFLPSPGLLDLLARADRSLGTEEPAVFAHLAQAARDRAGVAAAG